MPSSRVVVVTNDALGVRMAGPAIRALRLAEALSDAGHDVDLVTTADVCELPARGALRIGAVDAADVDRLVAVADVWVVQGNTLVRFPAIGDSGACVVVDLYDPFHLENLERSVGATPHDRLSRVHNATATLNRSMLRGDWFMCASERQRDFWLGALAALGRISPLTYDHDKALAGLVQIVPFGLDPAPPTRTTPVLRGVVDGIGDDEVVLLWGGGLYPWFDPLTLVRAVDVVRRDHPAVRLVFLGVGHPDPSAPSYRTVAATRALSDELGLTGEHVVFLDGWVPFEQRGSYLLEADIGVSTHHDHVETAYSFRTRLLDYLWAGLPVVATDGDVFAPLVTGHGAGEVVPADDVAALAEALTRLVADPARRAACAEASSALASEFTWDRVAAPLLAYCAAPRRAADAGDARTVRLAAAPFDLVRAPTPGPSGWRGEVALARQYLTEGGAGLLGRRLVGRALKLARRRGD